MFNITILDVAIGMIFIYLLLSLMCTAANEIIELMLKKRAIDLEKGIRELLDPGSTPTGDSTTPDIVRDLYNHPLINGLFEGTYETSRIANTTSVIRRTLLPSYIPARNFALAMMDLIVPGNGPANRSGASDSTPPSSSPASPSQVVVNVAGVTPPAAVPPAQADPDSSAVALRTALLASAGSPNPLAAAPQALTPQMTAQVRRALIPLIDAAGNDMVKVRENIEGWFNASMERVSGWYKRRTQVVLLILGIFVAITMNVDTITVVKRLSTDRPLRESLVAAADAYAKANAQPSASPAPTPAPTTPPNAVATPTPPACVRDAASAECEHAKVLQKERQDACQDPNSPKCKYVENQQQILALGLPIGWDDKSDPKGTFTGWSWGGGNGGWRDQICRHWLGWLLTALAISLGAPFWFDLLNKFMAVRGAVKPGKTSPDATT
jgi:hypothetical protein